MARFILNVDEYSDYYRVGGIRQVFSNLFDCNRGFMMMKFESTTINCSIAMVDP